MTKRYFFKDVYIFDGEGFFEGSLLTEGSIVKKMGKTITLDRDEMLSHEEISGNYILMPGMVNAHTHVPMTLFKGAAEDLPLHDWLSDHIFPLEAKFMSADMGYVAGLWGMAEMLMNGVTAFNDMYFFEEDIAKAAREIGIKLIMGEGIINFPAATGRTPEQTLEFTEEIAKKYADDPYIFPAVAPHSPYLTDDLYLVKSAEISDKYNIPLHIHMAETKKEAEDFYSKWNEREFVHFDKLGLLSERFVAAHSVWIDNEEMEIMAERGVTVAHCPASNMKLGSGLAPVWKMMKKGVNVTVGTDGSASNNNLDLLKEVELAAKLQKGINHDPTAMPALEALKTVTSNAAKPFGGSFGKLVEGGRADMVLVSLDSPGLSPHYSLPAALVYAASSRDIDTVFVEGEKVVEKGKLISLSIDELRKEFKKLSEEVRIHLK